MKIKFDFTRHQERPLIVGFQAEGQRYVELQEDTTTPSLLETITHIAGAAVDSLVAQGVSRSIGPSIEAFEVEAKFKQGRRQESSAWKSSIVAGPLSITPAELANEQKHDPSLQACFENIGQLLKQKRYRTSCMFQMIDGVLVRRRVLEEKSNSWLSRKAFEGEC
ncbi:hypothetical protein MTO96_036486 [Rhipicephalus appendiculatus]